MFSIVLSIFVAISNLHSVSAYSVMNGPATYAGSDLYSKSVEDIVITDSLEIATIKMKNDKVLVSCNDTSNIKILSEKMNISHDESGICSIDVSGSRHEFNANMRIIGVTDSTIAFRGTKRDASIELKRNQMKTVYFIKTYSPAWGYVTLAIIAICIIWTCVAIKS